MANLNHEYPQIVVCVLRVSPSTQLQDSISVELVKALASEKNSTLKILQTWFVTNNLTLVKQTLRLKCGTPRVQPGYCPLEFEGSVRVMAMVDTCPLSFEN